ncbi:MAG: hypothetical protein KDC71_02385 [Acidobacteria bacterium]|nr:hypothetical protein [Acidobacteriota bacterium]
MRYVGLILAVGSIALFAQQDDPANAINGVNNGTRGTQGAVVRMFAPPTVGGTPVGLEYTGSDLVGTDIGDDAIYFSTLNGASAGTSFTGVGNPIGITTDGTNFYQTDTTGLQVVVFNSSGTMTGSFSVAGQTTFPEGITYNPNTGHLYVVNGSGGNMVHEYTTAGAIVNSFPVLGSSQDGIAYDEGRNCYWLYDSGTDTVRQYDTSFNELSNFPGTINAGFSGGEGVAVAGDELFVVATGSDLVIVFGLDPLFAIPTLGTWGLIAFLTLLMGVGLVVVRRRKMQAA